ncbi:MAG TPA: DJ-1/PfpI family protein [Puia sp.]|jgi:putative intracellular protease/amidase|nr:DJ-1/PfpI family protein [Puia sp.]
MTLIQNNNKKRTCAVFIFDGFADQDVSLTMAWLGGQNSDFAIETFSTNGHPVTSASGLRVMPHTSLKMMDPEDFDLLLLPGGDKWKEGDNLDIFPLITSTFGKRPIAAISAAVLALADLGMLDDIPHTSNFPGFLKHYCPEYTGEDLYQNIPCVNTGNIITANGVALIEFAYEILKTFDVFNCQKAQEWKELYLSSGEVMSFFE